jgi:ATP-dependent Clp protease ATP-binding subunit ClpA
LIGRSEEVDFCRTLFARRDGCGIVVTGAAGVGKTRLAASVAAARMIDRRNVRRVIRALEDPAEKSGEFKRWRCEYGR